MQSVLLGGKLQKQTVQIFGHDIIASPSEAREYVAAIINIPAELVIYLDSVHFKSQFPMRRRFLSKLIDEWWKLYDEDKSSNPKAIEQSTFERITAAQFDRSVDDLCASVRVNFKQFFTTEELRKRAAVLLYSTLLHGGYPGKLILPDFDSVTIDTLHSSVLACGFAPYSSKYSCNKIFFETKEPISLACVKRLFSSSSADDDDETIDKEKTILQNLLEDMILSTLRQPVEKSIWDFIFAFTLKYLSLQGMKVKQLPFLYSNTCGHPTEQREQEMETKNITRLLCRLPGLQGLLKKGKTPKIVRDIADLLDSGDKKICYNDLLASLEKHNQNKYVAAVLTKEKEELAKQSNTKLLESIKIFQSSEEKFIVKGIIRENEQMAQILASKLHEHSVDSDAYKIIQTILLHAKAASQPQGISAKDNPIPEVFDMPDCYLWYLAENDMLGVLNGYVVMLDNTAHPEAVLVHKISAGKFAFLFYTIKALNGSKKTIRDQTSRNTSQCRSDLLYYQTKPEWRTRNEKAAQILKDIKVPCLQVAITLFNEAITFTKDAFSLIK